MTKVELFNITTAKEDQQKAEMLLTPEERIILCLDLMELQAGFFDQKTISIGDEIEWVELSLKHE